MNSLSPFKHLYSYANTKSDYRLFFGREPEKESVKRQLSKTKFLIVYGPSGSGKTSLLNAGILYPMRAKKEAMLSLRFNSSTDDFNSVFRKISESWSPTVGENLQLLYDCEKKIIDLEKERISLKESYLRDRTNANVERYNQCKENLKTEELNYSKAVAVLDDAFVNFYQKLDQVPVLILDQFEELFIFHSDSEDYVDNIGILLNLLLNNGFPIKIFLFIRSEYFGHLVHLEKYFPKVFYPKVLVDVPGRDTLEVITTSLFNEFKINAEKPVIDKILDNICIKRGKDTYAQSDLFFLPYLQIYLDALYQKVFKKYNKEDFDASNLKEINISIDDVRALGTIQKVLMDFIGSVNSEILKVSWSIGNLSIKKRIHEIKLPATLLLKKLVSAQKTKKRIYFSENGFNSDDLSYLLGGFLFDETVNMEDQQSILKLMLDILKKNRLIIIKENDKYIELVHDSLAEFISNIAVEKDVQLILAQKFISDYESHEFFKNKGEKIYLDKKTQKNIGGLEDLEMYLKAKDVEMVDGHEKFWFDSLWYNRTKKRRARWVRNTFFSIITLSLLAALGFLLNSEVANKRTTSEREKFETEKLKNRKQGEIFLNVGNAYGKGKSDLTKAYNLLEIKERDYLDIVRSKNSLDLDIWKVIEKPSRLWEKDTISENIDSLISLVRDSLATHEKYRIRRQYFEDLEGNIGKRPFYVSELDLDGQHILSTKTRMIEELDDTLLVYVQTHDNLQGFKMNLDQNVKSALGLFDFEISCFEPFESDGTINLLVSYKDSLIVLDENFVQLENGKKEVGYNFKLIEKLAKNKFLCLSDDKVKLEIYDLTKKTLSPYPFLDGYKIKEISSISYIKNTKEIIFGVRASNNISWIFKIDSSGIVNRIKFNDIGLIKSIKVKKNGDIFFTDATTVYKIKSSEINSHDVEQNNTLPLIVHSDDENKEIRTIDTDGENFIIGTQGNVAQTYFNSGTNHKTAIRMQKLIGHSEEIINVSYVRNGDFALTASHEGTIKIWDVRDKMLAQTKIKSKNNGISELQFRDGALFVAYRLKEPVKENGPGCLLKLNRNLDGIVEKYYYRGNSRRKNIELTSFDFEKNGNIVAGTFWGQELRNAQKQGSKEKSIISNISSTVRDVKILDSLMVVASDTGIELFIKNNAQYEKQLLPESARVKTQINSLAINNQASKIVGAGEDGNVYVWNMKDNELDTILHEHHDKVTNVCFSKDGNFFVSGSFDNKAIVWSNLSNAIPYKRKLINVHANDIEDIDISSDNIIATASSDKTVQLHKAYISNDTTIIVQRRPSLINNKNVSFRSVTFGETDSILYTGDKNGVIKKWNIYHFLEN